MNNNSFKSFDFEKSGTLDSNLDTNFPCSLMSVVGEGSVSVTENKAYFVYVHEGEVCIPNGYVVKEKMYSVVTGTGEIKGNKKTKAIVIVKDNYEPMFSLGGPIEEKGRLKYIDGCTDSLLIPPTKKGDSCLNHLHFPKGIDQTSHTHPSVRVGLVTKGEGLCKTPFGNVELREGLLFVIKPSDGEESIGVDGKYHANGTHGFVTFDKEMDVIAFHPDSDFGAEDDEHPMINRTIVNGVSAKNIADIQTK